MMKEINEGWLRIKVQKQGRSKFVGKRLMIGIGNIGSLNVRCIICGSSCNDHFHFLFRSWF